AALEALDRVLVGVVEAQSGLRGFLLTHREQFLEPYELGRRQALEALGEYEALAARNPTLAPEAGRLRDETAAVLDGLAAVLAAPTRTQAQAETVRVRLDRLRGTVAALRASRFAWLEAAAEESSRAWRRALAALVSATVLAVTAFAWAVVRVRSALRA